MTDRDRREFLQSTATLMLSAAAFSSAQTAESVAAARAFAYQHTPAPLPFDAKTLKGLSEKLIQSHWENNYRGSVAALNLVRTRLTQAMNDSNTPPYLYNGLKREQLIRTGSVVLHELYFANLGGNGQADAGMRTRIANSFGSFDVWETEFRKIAQGLGGGSGWVVMGYNQQLRVLENYWLADHASNPAYTTPVLVLDMYEHSYHIDYGAAAARYVDAFFSNIQWESVGQRLAQLS